MVQLRDTNVKLVKVSGREIKKTGKFTRIKNGPGRGYFGSGKRLWKSVTDPRRP